MSIEVPKNITLYMIIALVAIVPAGISEDKINAIEQRLDKAEAENKELRRIISLHDSLFAHPGIFERTESILKLIDALEEEVQHLERSKNDR